MEAKKLKKICYDIYCAFDSHNSDSDHDILLCDFIFDVLNKKIKWIEDTGFDALFEKNPKLARKFDDDLWDLFYSELTPMAFALGFTLGQMIEPTDAKILSHLKSIKRILKEKKYLPCLPYLPREKAA